MRYASIYWLRRGLYLKKVIIHEIGHYFGLGEADLRKIEKKKYMNS